MIRRLVALLALLVAATSLGIAPATAAASPTLGVVDPVVTASDPTDATFTLALDPDDGTLAPMGLRVLLHRWTGQEWVQESETFTNAVRSDAQADHAFTLSLSGLPDGIYDVVVSGVWTDAASVRHTFGAQGDLQIDRLAPGVIVATASPTVIYPEIDRYRDSTDLTVATRDRAVLSAEVIRGATGAVVRDLAEEGGVYRFDHALTWDGHTSTGTVAPAGAYVVRLRAEDAAGNVATRDVSLTVRSGRLTWVTWTRTLTPGQALKHRNVGGCSSLRPGVNGWTGGLGLWSNTTCLGGSGPRSVAEAVYSSVVPKAGVFAYGDYSVTTTGRAATSRPGSTGTISLYRADPGDFPKRTTLPARYGATTSHVLRGSTAVMPEGSVGWSTYALAGHRYDVRSFVVRLKIRVIR